MSLIIAMKNTDGTVIAGDIADASFTPGASNYGSVIPLPNHCCVLVTGNLEAVRHAVAETALPRMDPHIGAAGVAQLIHAALTLEVLPNIATLNGRTEVIVAGIDPIRHIHAPGLYCLDSARNFNLDIIDSGAIAAGATDALEPILTGLHRDATIDQQIAAIKDAYATTKLRWPEAVANHLLIGTITPATSTYRVY